MKASYHWIRALVPALTVSPEQLASRFTMAGLEVEGVTPYGEAALECVVVRVLGKKPHPTKSSLTLVDVDRGAGERLEIVCGAGNVPEPGGLVVLAPLGAKLPAKGLTIERRTIAGTVSLGMLCSEAELGLTDDATGILVLPADTAEPGTPLATAVPAAHDSILEIALTPNRPDGLGHHGLAREAAALFDLPWSPPGPDAPRRAIQGKIDSYIKVDLQDPEKCPHYGAAVVVDVTPDASPLWLRYRLASLGVRPISNVVDVTNLVLLEYGHPMHAFDLDRVRGEILVVRRANEGERLVTLDGSSHTLTEDDLVIADGEGPVALAGIMGGSTSEIRASTKRVVLECAYFEARGVRRAARRHGLHTESSHRFERGVDRGDLPDALTRATSLLTQLAGGAAVPGILHAIGTPVKNTVVRLRFSRLDQLLGTPVPHAEAEGILSRLGCVLLSSLDGVLELSIPTHRPDLAREVDLIEEVARVRGMDAIPTTLPRVLRSKDEAPREAILRRARAAGVELGLSEAITYSFVSRKELEALSAPLPAVVIKNPLSASQEVMRTSLLPGLLGALARARRHGERDVRLFTVGPLFLGDVIAAAPASEELPNERLTFAAILSGERTGFLAQAEPIDVWDAKGLADGFLRRMTGSEAEVRAFPVGACPAHLHPRGAALVSADGAKVGSLGPLHPDVAPHFDLSEGAMVVEIDLQAVGRLGVRHPRFAPIPRFPACTRDIAIVVHEGVLAGEVLDAVRSAAGVLAEHVSLFDRFTGGSIPKEHASLAFRVVYRAPDHTLTDAEVDAQHARVVAAVTRQFGATLRA
jgi:phenylalanyl-tRNA synthetase beta chain